MPDVPRQSIAVPAFSETMTDGTLVHIVKQTTQASGSTWAVFGCGERYRAGLHIGIDIGGSVPLSCVACAAWLSRSRIMQ